jgi:hypothetical protein
MRNSNRVFEIPLRGLVGAIVHRGVSQGGRNLSIKKRSTFWRKNAKEVDQVFIGRCARFTPRALINMRQRSLVLVVNPENPQVWTPTRIEKSEKKFTSVKKYAPVISRNTSTRRGNLKL